MKNPHLINVENREPMSSIKWPWVAVVTILLVMTGTLIYLAQGVKP
jgi:hypothetical protein